jgi:hypothetical protein
MAKTSKIDKWKMRFKANGGTIVNTRVGIKYNLIN